MMASGKRDRGESGVRDALERAFRELPEGSAEARLSHYCGRVWEVLRSPAFAALYRRSLVAAKGAGAERDSGEAGLAIRACLDAVEELLIEGIDGGRFTTPSPHAAARLIVFSLFARAHWCGERQSPGLAGPCTRAVAETLELVWRALGVPAVQRRRGPRVD